MLSKELKSKINNLKEVLKNFSTEVPLVGIALVKKGEGHTSSDNYTDLDEQALKDLSKLDLTIITDAISNHIERLDAILQPILKQEAEDKAIQDEIDRKAEEQRLEEERIQAQKDTIENEYKARVELGNKLVKMYLMDNSVLNLTTQESLEQLQKFSTIKALLELGSLKAAKELIMLAETDKIFTEERKVKYLSYL